MSKCVYCDSKKFGPGCPSRNSTNGLHKHNTNERRCIYCGGTAYGYGCLQAPTRKHIHGHGASKCIYCGIVIGGQVMGCKHSPINKHEF